MAETFYGTGKRKDAIARVWLVPGSGNITVNDKPLEEYFPRVALQQIARSPLALIAASSGFDVKATARGAVQAVRLVPCVTVSLKRSSN